MSSLNKDLNIEHLKNPVAGDYWQERFCLYHVVLKVLDNGNLVIAEKDRSVDDGQTVDLTKAYELTPTEHAQIVKYKSTSLDGFVADVVVDSEIAHSWVEAWEEEYKGRYRPCREPITTEPEVANVDGIQEALNNAMAEVLGYRNTAELLDAVPLDKRLPDDAPRQDKINNALAIAMGFENVNDLVEARGMRGKKNIDA